MTASSKCIFCSFEKIEGQVKTIVIFITIEPITFPKREEKRDETIEHAFPKWGLWTPGGSWENWKAYNQLKAQYVSIAARDHLFKTITKA